MSLLNKLNDFLIVWTYNYVFQGRNNAVFALFISDVYLQGEISHQ